MAGKNRRIRILENGPYHVTGGVPLYEKVITPKGDGYTLEEGRELPQAEAYRLCRCGKSANAPFCDRTHERTGFSCRETASRVSYRRAAQFTAGAGVDLLDDGRCALSRFCHTDEGTVWQLLDATDDPEIRELVIKAAGECTTGRLTILNKNGMELEPRLEPSIVILQDPEEEVSAGIFVRGGIPIESPDGQVYESRNRVGLCRCGQSRNKPFCDASHIRMEYHDKPETR
jgi:CDGSH-type Zn-finger protein